MAGQLYNRRRSAPRGAKWIGRGSPWGNPFIIGEHGNRFECIEQFKNETLPTLDLEPLIGEDLVCCCWPKPCHGNPILEEIERRYPRSVRLGGTIYQGMSDEDFENDRYA